MTNHFQNNRADIFWQGPGDGLLVTELYTEDVISEIAVMKVFLVSQNGAIPFADMIGRTTKVVIKCGELLDQDRFLSGIITNFHQGKTRFGNVETSSNKWYTYEATVQSPIWILTRTFRSRVYQHRSTQRIVKEILAEHGVKSRWHLKEDLPKREYCVQYQETCFNFASRLLEDDGVSYFYDHQTQQMVFVDHKAGYTECSPDAQALYREGGELELAQGKEESITTLEYEERLGTAKFTAREYDYFAPHRPVHQEDIAKGHAFQQVAESYEHDTNRSSIEEQKRIAAIRKEEEAGWAKKISGVTTCRSFATGFCFRPEGHFRPDVDKKKWLLVSNHITAEQGFFKTEFEAVPIEAPLRPWRKTPRPHVYGVQIATVVGPEGEQIHLDEHGRVRLQFHWDREGEKNDSSSMWVRVASGYAGRNYGIQFIPRIGHEVLVECVGGNPDRPIITDRVHNKFQKAPLNNATKTQNIIKTPKDHHILFEDKDKSEFVEYRSQGDKRSIVVKNESNSIGGSQSTNVGGNAKESVGYEKSITVNKKDFLIKVLQGLFNLDVVDGAAKLKITKDSITIECGAAKIVLNTSGLIEVTGKEFKLISSGHVQISGSEIDLN